MNKIRQHIPVSTEEPVKKKSSGENTARKFIRIVNVFSLFDRKAVMILMPYLFFLFLLALVYIGNSYLAEKTIRDIDRTEKDLKELRSEFITGRSELMYRSKLTEVAGAIQTRGVKESTVAPKKILLRKVTKN